MEIEKAPELKMWRIVKYCKSRKSAKPDGYKLMANDLIKLGRVRFKIRDIQSEYYIKLRAKIEAQMKHGGSMV